MADRQVSSARPSIRSRVSGAFQKGTSSVSGVWAKFKQNSMVQAVGTGITRVGGFVGTKFKHAGSDFVAGYQAAALHRQERHVDTFMQTDAGANYLESYVQTEAGSAWFQNRVLNLFSAMGISPDDIMAAQQARAAREAGVNSNAPEEDDTFVPDVDISRDPPASRAAAEPAPEPAPVSGSSESQQVNSASPEEPEAPPVSGAEPAEEEGHDKATPQEPPVNSTGEKEAPDNSTTSGYSMTGSAEQLSADGAEGLTKMLEEWQRWLDNARQMPMTKESALAIAQDAKKIAARMQMTADAFSDVASAAKTPETETEQAKEI